MDHDFIEMFLKDSLELEHDYLCSLIALKLNIIDLEEAAETTKNIIQKYLAEGRIKIIRRVMGETKESKKVYLFIQRIK